MSEVKDPTRAAIIQAARRYCTGEPGSDDVRDAYNQMLNLLSAGYQIAEQDALLSRIANYVLAPGYEISEADYEFMAQLVLLPDCPQCGIDGCTVYHADATDEQPIVTCLMCGHTGEA